MEIATPLLVLSLAASVAGAQWVETASAGKYCVSSLASVETNLFASFSGDGVFLSTNNGTNWRAVNGGLTDLWIHTLAVIDTSLFAGTLQGGVFTSSNNGTSWKEVNTGLWANQWGSLPGVNVLAVNGTTLFAGTGDRGVYRSTNKGGSWDLVNSGLPKSNVSSFAFSGTNLFAGLYAGVFLSTNNGTDWTETNSGPGGRLVPLAALGTNLFAGTYGEGILLSTNNGTTWTSANSGLTHMYVYCFVVSGKNLFAGTDGGVFLSTNNGTNWTGVSAGLGDSTIWCLSTRGSNLFAGTYTKGVWRRPLSEMLTDVECNAGLPQQISLYQNYPNPFNPSTTIRYGLPERARVSIAVYNTLGQQVAKLVSGEVDAGYHEVMFDASGLPSGVYFYRLQAGSYVEAKKLLVVK